MKIKKYNKARVEGVVRRTQKDFGWLLVEGYEHVLIPPPALRFVMDGDTVKATLTQRPKGPVADIAEVTKRANKKVFGKIVQDKKEYLLVSLDNLFPPIVLKKTKELRDQLGALAEVEIERYPGPQKPAFGNVLRLLGDQGSLETKIQMILSKRQVRQEFSEEVANSLKQVSQNPSEKDQKGRKDLQNLPLCTIDGETAKDFDDAVFAMPHKEGFRLVVAIADVSHYVKPGSPLDQEAFTRSTSLYYPGHCVPMLPEVLSNGLCSLKPKVPRLCMVADLVVRPTGTLASKKFYEAVIKSHARLTYTQVQQFFDKKHLSISKELSESLLCLRQVALLLRKARKKRGAIDFDITESFVELNDEGEPIHIAPQSRLEAHCVIEDLMVAANEAVAEYLEKWGYPSVFRIHQAPDSERLKEFLAFAELSQFITPKEYKKLSNEPKPKDITQFLEKTENHPLKPVISSLLLRSMMQAKYSTDNIGHYGLASKSYTHFTSPIRRYPDLMVHRHLKWVLSNLKKKLTDSQKEAFKEKVQSQANQCSTQERAILEVEREVNQLHAAWLMQDHVGLIDQGVIISCTEFGFFVRLKQHHVEGLVHVSTFGKERMIYDAKRFLLESSDRKKRFQMGDLITVQVIHVNLDKYHIDLKVFDS